jgi:ribonuclease HI
MGQEPKYHFYTFSDGSCNAKDDDRQGAWNCILVGGGGKNPVTLTGTENPSTITRCEFLPILAALRWIRKNVPSYRGLRVRCIMDSEFVVRTIAGEYEAKDALGDLYEAYKYLSRNMVVHPQWRPRNTHEYQTIVDGVAGNIRKRALEAHQFCTTTALPETDLTAFDHDYAEGLIHPPEWLAPGGGQ